MQQITFSPPFHLICIKQSLLTITKAFLAKWSLVNIVQIPHPLTERLPPDSLWAACSLPPCFVWPAQAFEISQLYIKEFLYFLFFQVEWSHNTRTHSCRATVGWIWWPPAHFGHGMPSSLSWRPLFPITTSRYFHHIYWSHKQLNLWFHYEA